VQGSQRKSAPRRLNSIAADNQQDSYQSILSRLGSMINRPNPVHPTPSSRPSVTRSSSPPLFARARPSSPSHDSPVPTTNNYTILDPIRPHTSMGIPTRRRRSNSGGTASINYNLTNNYHFNLPPGSVGPPGLVGSPVPSMLNAPSLSPDRPRFANGNGNGNGNGNTNGNGTEYNSSLSNSVGCILPPANRTYSPPLPSVARLGTPPLPLAPANSTYSLPPTNSHLLPSASNVSLPPTTTITFSLPPGERAQSPNGRTDADAPPIAFPASISGPIMRSRTHLNNNLNPNTNNHSDGLLPDINQLRNSYDANPQIYMFLKAQEMGFDRERIREAIDTYHPTSLNDLLRRLINHGTSEVYFILFYFIQFYSIRFYSVLFCSILF
jgi:hypothetical protein